MLLLALTVAEEEEAHRQRRRSTVATAAPATRAVRHTHAFPLLLVQVAHASSNQNVMSIWTSRHMFDQFSFTRYLVGTPHYACFNEYTTSKL